MEGRGRQHGIHGFGERQRVQQIGVHERDPIAERREPSTCRLEHRGRAVQRHDPSAREPSGEELGHASRTAPSVQDGLVAVELEPIDHLRTPPVLRVGDPIVGLGIPLA
jgi:hypothetical protein